MTDEPGACLGSEEEEGLRREEGVEPIGESIKGMGVGLEGERFKLPNWRDKLRSEEGSGKLISFSRNRCSNEMGDVAVGERKGELDK